MSLMPHPASVTAAESGPWYSKLLNVLCLNHEASIFRRLSIEKMEVI